MSNQPNESCRETERASVAMPGADRAAALAAARPKVRELLVEFLANPAGDAGAIVETLLLDQVAGAPAREAEVLEFHQERKDNQALEDATRRTAKRLEGQNRKLKRQLAKKDAIQNQVREYIAQAAKEGRAGREELTPQRIYDQISAVIGMGESVIPRVEKGPVPHA